MSNVFDHYTLSYRIKKPKNYKNQTKIIQVYITPKEVEI